MEKTGDKGTDTKKFGPQNFFPPCGVEGVEWDLFERHTILTFHFTSFGIWPTRIHVMSPFGRKKGHVHDLGDCILEQKQSSGPTKEGSLAD